MGWSESENVWYIYIEATMMFKYIVLQLRGIAGWDATKYNDGI